MQEANMPRSARLEPDLRFVKDGWRCDVFALPTRDGQWIGYASLISLTEGRRVERLVVAGEHATNVLFIAVAREAALERMRNLCDQDAQTPSITGTG